MACVGFSKEMSSFCDESPSVISTDSFLHTALLGTNGQQNMNKPSTEIATSPSQPVKIKGKHVLSICILCMYISVSITLI